MARNLLSGGILASLALDSSILSSSLLRRLHFNFLNKPPGYQSGDLKNLDGIDDKDNSEKKYIIRRIRAGAVAAGGFITIEKIVSSFKKNDYG